MEFPRQALSLGRACSSTQIFCVSVFPTSSNHVPMPVQHRGCFGRAADTHVHTHTPPKNPTRRFLGVLRYTRVCLAQDTPETAWPQAGPALLSPARPLRGQGQPHAGRQAGRQAAGHGRGQVPGHRHHGYLHIHGASHTTVPWSPALLPAGAHRPPARAPQGLMEGGCVRAKTDKTPFLLVFPYVSSHLQTCGGRLLHTPHPKSQRLRPVGDVAGPGEPRSIWPR